MNITINSQVEINEEVAVQLECLRDISDVELIMVGGGSVVINNG
jgi:hypothetical protein